MALVFSTIANGGQRPTPRLVLAVGETPAVEPRSTGVLNPSAASMASQVLVDAYQAGAAGTGLPQTGIAGTARRTAPGIPGAPDHAWFVGYAPVDAPRYAVAVLVEHAEDAWGLAAPIGVQILELAQSSN
jgi:cell division protein FtsI/penicillin-binding protein 2